ncbi:39S ribosomal protein L1, mitochondrial isoform X2 [Boleophthalmus pectinirostris]|uniref:39S ribosomal protein L1, mitochondrial isoform X2 n=1 Tax=Boleophthalmus pectinirostris TaxID=150288 RepID=UPI0024321BC3|nr:39S ribosomal protein L1, mitochondrial isoform X2 [Boleophthalmus pectinirostris]
MATCSRAVWRVVSGCQRLSSVRPVNVLPQTPVFSIPGRTFAVARTKTKDKKEEEKKEEKKRQVIDDSGRHKPYGKTAWAPVDDVYILRYYPRPVHRVDDAVELLKTYRALDFTPERQQVYIDLRLDMKLEKKKRVDPFVSTVHLPHPFKTEMNKVLVFTEDADQARVAQENGAAIVGGTELMEKILDDEISADFYVAVPDMLPKLVPLKNKLRKKFPKSKRGSVGLNITRMLELFKTGHEYTVEDGCFVRTQIATLDMPSEHILENLHTIMADVYSHRQSTADLVTLLTEKTRHLPTTATPWTRKTFFPVRPQHPRRSSGAVT